MNLWALLLSCLGMVTSSCSTTVDQPRPVSVIVLVGTDREDSNTQIVAQHLMDAYVKSGVESKLWRVTDFGIDEFYAPTAYQRKPASFTTFNKELMQAELVVLVTPEYNHSVPAPMARVVNLLDPASLRDRKFAVVSLSIGSLGGSYARDHLKETLGALGAQLDDDLNLTLGEVHKITKGTGIYAEHADKIAAALAY